MSPRDEKELHRLTEMLQDVDATLPRESPLHEGLKKAGLALSVAFAHDLRPEIEGHFKTLGAPLTESELARLKSLGLDP